MTRKPSVKTQRLQKGKRKVDERNRDLERTLHRATVMVKATALTLNSVLMAVVPVVEKHAPVTKKVKGEDKQMCPACKVAAPCFTFENLSTLADDAEKSLDTFLARYTQGMSTVAGAQSGGDSGETTDDAVSA